MAIYNGIIIIDENEPIKNGFLFKCSSITTTNDMIEMTPESVNSFSSLPIYFNCWNSLLNNEIQTIINNLSSLIQTIIETAQKQNSINMFIDSFHLQNEPENATIRTGSIRGIEKVLYVEMYGK